MDAESGPKISASKGSMTDFSENCAGASCSLQSASATQDKVADEAQATEPEDAFADEAGNTKLHVCDCVELALEPPEQKEGAPQQGGDAELGSADTFHEDAACATAADQPKIEIDKGMVRGILLLHAPAIAASVAMTFALTRLRLLHQDSVPSVPDQAAQLVINTVENDVTMEHVNEAEPGSEGSSLDQTLDSTKSLPGDCPK